MKDYIYDGSFDGLLTAIFYAYSEKETAQMIKERDYQPNLLNEKIIVATENDKAERVYQSLCTKLSYNTLFNIYYLYLSDLLEAEKLILNYIKLCFKYSDSINLAKNNDIIRLVDKYVRRVTIESHRFVGFVRFQELAPLVFYSAIEPDHNILPLMAKHFKERFSDQHFIIHDLKREYALVYNLNEAYFRDLSAEEGLKLTVSSDVDPFGELFKSFYDSINISERKNDKQRRSYMPTRYWKHLVEINS